MNILKRSVLVTIIIGVLSHICFSKQTTQEGNDLIFELSQQKVRWIFESNNDMSIQPKYMAVLYLKEYSPHARNFTGFRESLKDVVSPEQSKFMQDRYLPEGHFIRNGSLTEKGYDITLYGISEKDIKTMVTSFIPWINKQADTEIEKARANLKNNHQKKTELEVSINKLQDEQKDINAKLIEIKSQVPYRNNEDALESIQNFNRTLQIIAVEIVGIKAKLDLIKKEYNNLENPSNNYPKGTSDLLFQMRLTQEIELVGALARENAAKSASTQAMAFSNLLERSETISRELETNQQKSVEIQNMISETERNLTNPSSMMRHMELADKNIVLFSIQN